MSNDDFVLTWTEASRLVLEIEDIFAAGGLAPIEAIFTEDAVIHFADFAPLRGRAEIAGYFRARLARTLDYRRTKTLELVMGNRLTNAWTAEWTDARTGKAMQARGIEIWILRGRKIASWDATFNVWEKGGPPVTPVL